MVVAVVIVVVSNRLYSLVNCIIFHRPALHESWAWATLHRIVNGSTAFLFVLMQIFTSTDTYRVITVTTSELWKIQPVSFAPSFILIPWVLQDTHSAADITMFIHYTCVFVYEKRSTIQAFSVIQRATIMQIIPMHNLICNRYKWMCSCLAKEAKNWMPLPHKFVNHVHNILQIFYIGHPHSVAVIVVAVFNQVKLQTTKSSSGITLRGWL